MAVARGDEPADVVVAGGRVLSVFTREWLAADVAIADGHVVAVGPGYEGRERVDAAGAWVAPGLIDAHMHIESSKLNVDEFARAVLPHGTTAVVADPHELANVLGVAGIHWLLEVTEDLPLDVFVMASSCVPASRFESPRGPLTATDLKGLLTHPRVIGIAEMMNFPGVVAGDPDELAKVALSQHIDGHAPGLRGRELNAYIAAGIRSDHEATTGEEALEKLRLGMGVMIREASIARNLADLLPLVLRYGPHHFCFCTDDREPNFIAEEGHLNQMVRVAVAGGVRAEDALTMASHNAARQHGLHRHGAIAPGYVADLLILDELESFRPRLVLKRGRPVTEVRSTPVPQWIRQSMNLAPLDEKSFQVAGSGHLIRAIRVIPGQLLTGTDIVEPAIRDGCLVADPDRDLTKIAVVERHHATGRIGVGFATGIGLRRGAFASTVAHDAHNVVVIGADDASMAACVRRLGEIGGGVTVAEGGEVRGELALPIAGLMSDRPLAEVHERLTKLEQLLAGMGVAIAAPFMTISFLALSVIPELKITDRGLVDVGRFELVPLEVL
ncbi:MAG: adenine deaminase [Candidatus Dormibacteraceae bacterium]